MNLGCEVDIWTHIFQNLIDHAYNLHISTNENVASFFLHELLDQLGSLFRGHEIVDVTLFVGWLALDDFSTFSSSGDLLFHCCLVLATQGVEQMSNSAALEFGEHFVVVDNFFGGAVALDGDQGAERFDGLG